VANLWSTTPAFHVFTASMNWQLVDGQNLAPRFRSSTPSHQLLNWNCNFQTFQTSLNSSGLYYKHVHGQMSIIFHATILAVKNVRSLWEKISFIFYVHGQMSVKTDIWLCVRTFDCAYRHMAINLRFITQKPTFQGHMPVNNVFITQATGPLEDHCQHAVTHRGWPKWMAFHQNATAEDRLLQRQVKLPKCLDNFKLGHLEQLILGLRFVRSKSMVYINQLPFYQSDRDFCQQLPEELLPSIDNLLRCAMKSSNFQFPEII